MVFLIFVAYASGQALLRGIEQGLSRAVENAAERVIEREINRENFGGGRGGAYNNNGFNNNNGYNNNEYNNNEYNNNGFNQGGNGRQSGINDNIGSSRFDNNYRDISPFGGIGSQGIIGQGVGRAFDRKCNINVNQFFFFLK